MPTWSGRVGDWWLVDGVVVMKLNDSSAERRSPFDTQVVGRTSVALFLSLYTTTGAQQYLPATVLSSLYLALSSVCFLSSVQV